MPRPIAPVCILVAMLTESPAQQPRPSQDELLAQKLQSSFLTKATWTTDWRAALATAAERQQLIFGYFTTVNY